MHLVLVQARQGDRLAHGDGNGGTRLGLGAKPLQLPPLVRAQLDARCGLAPGFAPLLHHLVEEAERQGFQLDPAPAAFRGETEEAAGRRQGAPVQAEAAERHLLPPPGGGERLGQVAPGEAQPVQQKAL